jgi:hypothetical protein
VVRAGTPAPIAARLNEAVNAGLKPLMICRDPTPRPGFHHAPARLWGDEAGAPEWRPLMSSKIHPNKIVAFTKLETLL